MVRALAENGRGSNSDNMVAAIFRCVAACLLSMLEGLLEAFNSFAFVHVAIYGVDYLTAGSGVVSLHSLSIHKYKKLVLSHTTDEYATS